MKTKIKVYFEVIAEVIVEAENVSEAYNKLYDSNRGSTIFIENEDATNIKILATNIADAETVSVDA